MLDRPAEATVTKEGVYEAVSTPFNILELT